jgi:hypothetical protein
MHGTVEIYLHELVTSERDEWLASRPAALLQRKESQ